MDTDELRAAMVTLLAAARRRTGDHAKLSDIRSLEDDAFLRLSRETVRRLDSDARADPSVPGGYDLLDAQLGRLILDGINHDIRVGQAIRGLLSYFRHQFPRARGRSRARRLDINLTSTAPAELARVLSENQLPVVPEVIARIKALRATNPDEVGVLAKSIADFDLNESEAMFVAFTLHQAGETIRPARMLKTRNYSNMNTGQARRYARILSEAEVLEVGPNVIVDRLIEEVGAELAQRGILSTHNEHQGQRSPQLPLRMAYVAASTLPFNKVGYTTRTHRVVKAINNEARALGAELLVVARPGYPGDRFDLRDAVISDVDYSDVDGIRYHYLDTSVLMQDSLTAFARAAALTLAEFFVEHDVRAVTAASNHVNALAALIAARALGIPFTYEIRGLWEETRAAKHPGWERTERFAVERTMERHIIEAADNTFFITRQVRDIFFGPEELDRGRRAFLAPNCAVLDDTRFQMTPYSGNIKDVLELLYVGSLVEYEGLQLVLEALAAMPDRARFRLNLVGGGSYAQELEAQASRLDLEDVVRFIGRVEPDNVQSWFDRADLVIVPRIPVRVCALVGSLKPLEAMSYGRVVLSSDVAPATDLIRDGKTGYLFKAGDVDSLTLELRRLHENQAEFPRVAEAAMRYISSHRDWQEVGRRILTANLEKVSQA